MHNTCFPKLSNSPLFLKKKMLIPNWILLSLPLQAWKNSFRSPQNTLVHRHRLLYTGTNALLSKNQNGIWKCVVCKNTSDTLNQTSFYHCVICNNFDICCDCFKPKRHPGHTHELKLVNTSLVYAQDHWTCNICGNESRWYEKYVIILVVFLICYWYFKWLAMRSVYKDLPSFIVVLALSYS